MCFRSRSQSSFPFACFGSPVGDTGAQPIRASEHNRDDKGSDLASRLVWLVNKDSVAESYC